MPADSRTRKRKPPPRGSQTRKSGERGLDAPALREIYLYMRLAREWDLRFEKMFRTGALSKWYSAVGNEATTVAMATALAPGDVLCSLHRDSGAILRYYLDTPQVFPQFVDRLGGRAGRRPSSVDSRDLLYRLACQMLGKAAGFSGGYERSYHYGLFQEDDGIIHIGMISHLGSMIPVAAGAGLALKQNGTDRVAVNFIGEGGTSTGDFHEGLNMAAVLKLPLILVIENNGYAFSTPTSEQFLCEDLASRGKGYGIPGVRVDGNSPEDVWKVAEEAVARARRGEGPTLIEAMVGRLRGHSEGDDSLAQVPGPELEQYQKEDPVLTFGRRLVSTGVSREEEIEAMGEACAALILEMVDKAQASADPDPTKERPVYAD